jgi:NAD+ kinase
MGSNSKKILLFGRPFSDDFRLNFRLLINKLRIQGAQIIFFKPFHEFAEQTLGEEIHCDGFFKSTGDLTGEEKLMLSIGGDGTFLEAMTIVRDLPVPIAGINSGRLGFLADISQEEISKAVDSIFNGLYKIEERTLLMLDTEDALFGDFNIALNEVTVHKRDDSSMITIHAYLDGAYLNSYWADGLIVSTPTGSTAYSLSVGGPLVLQGSNDFILSPIAPHNLTVRPLVYPDDMELTLRIDGRSRHILVSLDSRSVVMESGFELKIRKAPYSIKTLRLKDHEFYNILRSKLMWGADKRN